MAVRVVLLVMGLNGIVCWWQVIRVSAVVGLDFVIDPLSEQETRRPDKIGPIANENVCGTSLRQWIKRRRAIIPAI